MLFRSDLKAFFAVIQGLNADGHLLAYHDRSDGGLLTSVVEMAFAGHCGLNIVLDSVAEDASEINGILFNEELGAVIQVRQDSMADILAQFSAAGLGDCVSVIGQPRPELATARTIPHQEKLAGGLVAGNPGNDQ